MCAILVCTIALVFAIGEFVDFSSLHSFEAHDHWDLVTFFFNQDVFVVDELSAPLLPLAAIVYLVTVLATLRTKIHRFSFLEFQVSRTRRNRGSRHLNLGNDLIIFEDVLTTNIAISR